MENTGVDHAWRKQQQRGAGMDPVAVSKYPAEDEQRRLSPLVWSQAIVVINLITVEADGLLVGEFEVCESMEEVVVLVAQERLYLLYWSWIGDSSLPVLNRGVEHLRDVDDHIWTERPALGSPRVSRWKLLWRQKAPTDK